MLGARWAFVRHHVLARKGRVITSRVCTGVFLVCLAIGVRSLPEHLGHADVTLHSPLGVAKGIYPGRVVWVHAPDATDWAGWSSNEPWWQSNHTDRFMVEAMVSRAIRDVAGQENESNAWSALFTNFNASHDRGLRGYQPSEKVTIKINLTTCNSVGNDCDSTTQEKTNNLNRIDNSPQMLLELLRELVCAAGVPQTNISIGDPTAFFPGFLYRALHTEFPDVNYFAVKGGGGRTAASFSQVPMFWSTSAADGKHQDYIPSPFAEADYLINFAILKGHSSGVTLCGKNLYGALMRCPDGFLYGHDRTNNYYDMHLSLPNDEGPDAHWSPGMGHYRAMVDLMGNKHLGGKTLLCLIDGLFGGYYWDSHPYTWKMPPFGDGTNADWPSSLFVSQDPVAIDSVAYDFLLHEWPAVVNNGEGGANSLQGGAEDYLHEAALADTPPSGTVYDPERDGVRMHSLGVHEHWNNPIDKQYSRNLGQTNGIELLYTKLIRLGIRRTEAGVSVSWPASPIGSHLQGATSLNSSSTWIGVSNIPPSSQGQVVISNQVSGPSGFFRLGK
jgi:hypothetical protein